MIILPCLPVFFTGSYLTFVFLALFFFGIIFILFRR